MNNNPHALRAYDDALDQCNKQFLQLFQGAITALDQACMALSQSNTDLARQVIAEDEILDALHDAVNNRCMNLLASFAPVSSDLQFILSLMKLSGTLERIGDFAAQISKYSIKLSSFENTESTKSIVSIFNYIIQQMKRSYSAFESRDIEMIRSYMEMHQKKDNLVTSITDTLSTLPEYKNVSVPALAQLIFISRTLEFVWNYLRDMEEEISQL